MDGINIFSSVNSLALTFMVIGFGYLSILGGYYLAGKKDDFFAGKLKATDKMMLSFIVGAVGFLSLSFKLGLGSTDLMRNLIDVVVYQTVLSASFALFISRLLKQN